MPVTLRKRKAAAEPAPPPPAKKKSAKPAAKVHNAAAAKDEAKPSKDSKASSHSSPTIGSTISLENFGGKVTTHEGKETNLGQLVADSKNGVVLFTYPKASTPGCTKQACMFRDEYKPLTATGFAIYGLSRDSPNANTNFVTKQSLPYPLLCDPAGSLITAIGLRKQPSGTTRGVFVVDKSGKVLAAEPGSPDGTVAVVRRLVGDAGGAEPEESVKHSDASQPADITTDKSQEATIEKKPLDPTPSEDATKATASASMTVPGHALENSAKDVKIAEVAADVADSAATIGPIVSKPGPVEFGEPHGTNTNTVKDAAIARVAAEVADTARKIDPATPDPA